jgi:hypothetical protein
VSPRSSPPPSRWNLLLYPLAVAAGALAWLLLVLAALALHAWRFGAREFPGGLGPAALALALLPPVLPALSLGALAANALVALVRPARRALEAEGRGTPGAALREAQRDLARSAAVQLAIAVAIMAAGALLLR